MDRPYDIEDLKRLTERLRDPEYGCPWDLKQTYQSIAPFILEECLELIDALEQWDAIEPTRRRNTRVGRDGKRQATSNAAGGR